MIVPDNETAVDLLYYEAIAKTVVRLVEEKSDEPLSIGIHGDWGAGKSSVLMMVDQAFEDVEGVLCVRFNGWLFQGFEDAKAVLIETIIDELLRKRSTGTKVADQAKKVLRRVDWMKIVRKTAYFSDCYHSFRLIVTSVSRVSYRSMIGAWRRCPDLIPR